MNSKMTAAHLRRKRRGIQGAAAWSWKQVKQIQAQVEYSYPFIPAAASCGVLRLKKIKNSMETTVRACKNMKSIK